jgi:P27 family predicted phage terminase small subunit
MEPHPPVPDVIPYAPKFLNDEAKDEWNRMVNILLDLGLYTEVDHAALAMYCQAWGRWVDAECKLKKSGQVVTSEKTGILYQHPYLSIANRAWQQMREMLSEFGLTPAERSRLHVTPVDEEPSLAEQLFAMAGGAQVKDGGGD